MTELLSAYDQHLKEGKLVVADVLDAEIRKLRPAALAERTDRPIRWRAKRYGNASGSQSVYGGDWVVAAFGAQGFEGPVEDDHWDVLFTHFACAKALNKAHSASAPDLPARPQGSFGRLVNHCDYFRAAGQKCFLAKHITRLRKRDSFLRTFLLRDPEAHAAWRTAAAADPARHWIAKPCVGGRSQGIRLLRGDEEPPPEFGPESWAVAQEFIERPYLGWDGRKFHLRLFAFVSRWHPVPVVLLYDEGLVFRSSLTYDKERPDASRDVFSGISGTVDPLPLASLWEELKQKGHDEQAHSRILEVLGALFEPKAVRESFGDAALLAESHRGFGCFDLFGFDVMLDEDLQPHILEANMGPDMWIDVRGTQEQNRVLRIVKVPLMEQVLQWMELSVRQRPQTQEEAEALEERALVNFTRVPTGS